VTQFDVTVRGGKKLTLTAAVPKGHANNPMSDAEVELKFLNLCEPLLDEAQRKTLLAALWKIDSRATAGHYRRSDANQAMTARRLTDDRRAERAGLTATKSDYDGICSNREFI